MNRSCIICAKDLKIHVNWKGNRSYTGGHYFGKIPVCHAKDERKALKAGFTVEKIGDLELRVLKKEAKPYKHVEYWECEECYKEVSAI